MAGAFTHLTLLEEALGNPLLNKDLKKILRGQRKYAMFGSVSPDLPYLSMLKATADAFHHQATRGFIDACCAHVRAQGPINTITQRSKLAWIFGYVSHIIEDVVIHPIVAAEVGSVLDPGTSGDHRTCEMLQDSMVFQHFHANELFEAEYIDLLMNVSKSPDYSSVVEMWGAAIAGAYQFDFTNPSIEMWLWRFITALDLVEDGRGIADFTRHIFDHETRNLLYQSAVDIRRLRPQELERFYDAITLPDGSKSDFLTHGFQKAIDELIPIWNELYRKMIDPGEPLIALIPNLNLDDGINAETNEMEFWSA